VVEAQFVFGLVMALAGLHKLLGAVMLVSLRSVPGVTVIAELEKTPPLTTMALLAEVAATCTPDSDKTVPTLRIAFAGVLEAFRDPVDFEPLPSSGEQVTYADPAPVAGKLAKASPLLLPKQLCPVAFEYEPSRRASMATWAAPSAVVASADCLRSWIVVSTPVSANDRSTPDTIPTIVTKIMAMINEAPLSSPAVGGRAVTRCPGGARPT
jgi:hypothetical protein